MARARVASTHEHIIQLAFAMWGRARAGEDGIMVSETDHVWHEWAQEVSSGWHTPDATRRAPRALAGLLPGRERPRAERAYKPRL